MRLATDLLGGLVQRQPPPRRFHIYRFRLGSSPHTPAPEPTTELCIPAPVHRSHPLSFIGPETGKSQLSRPAAYAQRTGKTTSAGLRSVRLRGKVSRLWWRWEDSNLRAPCVLPLHAGRPTGSVVTITTLSHLHEGGARLSRLSPLRVGCLRLAPIGTRFCFLLVLYPRKPVQLVLRMSTGSGADGWTRTNGIPPGAVLYRLSYVCMRGVLVFPSRQIFSVPRFCQQITGAITTSRLEGLTSGLRITHTAVPLYARHSRCPRRIGGIGGDRTHDLLITNELLCQLSYDTGSPPCLRPGGRADVRQRGLRPRDRVPARIALGTPEEWM